LRRADELGPVEEDFAALSENGQKPRPDNIEPLVPPNSDEPRAESPALKIVVAAILVAIGATFCSWTAWSQRPTGMWGTFQSNWYNYVNSPQGGIVYLLVFLAASFISGLIFYALWRRS
jgi:hypothetical protein